MPPKPRLSREQSLDAKPVATPVVKREPLPDGGQRVTVKVHPSGFQRWLLRAPEGYPRQYELDAMGVEVLAMCDGQKTTHYIVEAFAKRHRIHPHEAEQAVAAFLQTMMRKGLVSVVVSKE
jgi:hypothetical protein